MLRGVPALLVSSFVSLSLGLLASSQEAAAIVQVDADDAGREVVIVNGSLSGSVERGNAIRQRGAVASLQIPRPEVFSAERLLSQHSLLLDGQATCDRQFCLVSESIDAQLLAQPDARYLLGLGFNSQLTNTPARREPLNLVAVVDRSASMRGLGLELTRRGLAQVVRQLTPQDQLTLVVYGSTARTYFPPTQVDKKGRKRLLSALAKLRTDDDPATLEAGLSFGFRMARATGEEFAGSSRVMLFTDERIAAGSPQAATLLSLAQAGTQLGIGLTTSAMAMPFDPRLAALLGSVRGSNLAFVRSDADVARVFGNELETLTSELAHDVRINITPARGYSIVGLYGVPGAQVSTGSPQSLELTVPTAFLGSRSGSLFVALAKLPGSSEGRDEPLAHVALAYQPLHAAEPAVDALLVNRPANPSTAMQLGRLLIDEFTTLQRATAAYHIDNDRQAAFEQLHAFATRLRSSRIPGLERERRVVNTLEEQLAFLSGRADDVARSRVSRLWGVWRVRSVQGTTDFRANERIEFTPDSKFRFFEKESGRHVVASVSNISTNRQQIVMDYSGVVYNYEVRGSELVLEERPGTLVFLQRSSLD